MPLNHFAARVLALLCLAVDPPVYCQATSAPDNSEKSAVTRDVLGFLKNTEFNFTAKSYYPSQILITSTFVYKDFAYDANDETLNFVYYTHSECLAIRDTSIGSSDRAVLKCKVYLKTCEANIGLYPATDDPQFKGKTDVLHSIVSIRAEMCKGKAIQKKSNHGASSHMRTQFTTADYKALDSREWDDGNINELNFRVAPELGTRLKTALADLLRVHGVNVSKY